jgi:proteasome accessory factor A
VDERGRFQLSDKAWGMNCVLGYNGIVLDRPIFSIGHLFKALMFRAWSSPREFSRLFSPKQRLQVCLGDSNMAEEAEYLRIGTTLLVLDAIEAGYLSNTPRISRPIKSLRAICADPSLAAAVRFKDGKNRTAIEIQKRYYEACAKFVNESKDTSDEAKDILNRWGEVLSLLETNPSALVGRLDWVTKRYLLETTTEESDDLAVKKKIDLRYHELSADGYYRQLETTGITRAVLTPEEIEAATQTPPKDTPATIRSRYLKTFAPSQRILGVNWNTITISQDFETKHIELSEESVTAKESPAPPTEKDSR